VRRDGRVQRLAGAEQIAAADDLALRAACLLQQACDCALGADLRIDKRIPMGGGFGGGSSDAASVLCALNALWGCGLDADRLAQLGLQLGADVPLFVRGRSAWAEGLGERLVPMDLPPRWFVLVDAGVHLSTGELFQAPELTRNAPPMTMADFASDLLGRNAFAVPVRRRSAQLGALLDRLSELGAGGLTGSGGGCFAAADTPEQAQSLLGELGRFGRCIVVRGVNLSPLHEQLDAWQRRGSMLPQDA
jgi:4-diphosphocytidyl-2-C-methyl-D-erythritol kinase